MTFQTVNGDGYDEELVQRYLEVYSKPSVETMRSWIPSDYDKEGWEQFNKQSWEYRLDIFRRVMPNGNVVIDGLPTVPISKLFIKHSKEAIQLEPCEVISISQSEPYAEFVTYKCQSCGDTQTIKKAESGEKLTCTCSKPKLIEVTSVTNDAIDSQYIRLQEVQVDGATPPSTINGLLKGENMIWSTTFNERVSPVGMLRYTKVINPRTRQTEYKPWFEIFGVKKIDPDAGTTLSREDVEYIENEMAKPDYYNKLIRSVFPSIWGMHSMKEAIVLALASIKLPKPARILIVTDPGMGKSDMAKFMQLYYPSAILTQMGRSTGTGLTVSSEKDEDTGRSHIGRGALVQANNGVVVMDEVQFGDAKTFMMLNDVMESGQVKYAFRGGNVGHIDANCAIIMLSNPHEGRFADTQAIGEILKFMGNALPQQLSRLQYILLRRDKLSPEEQRKIAVHMAKHNKNNPLFMTQYQENWYEEIVVGGGYDIEIIDGVAHQCPKTEERFGTKWIKKIFRYIINEIQVSEMPQEHVATLVDYYMKNRTQVDTDTNKMLTNRFMEHGQNLAIYMARIKGKSSPTAEEIFHTMELLEKSTNINAFDPKTGKYDYQQLDTVRPEEERDKMDKEEQFEIAIKKALKDENGNRKPYFTFDDLLYHLQFMPDSKWKDSSETKIRKELERRQLSERHGQGKYSLW